MGPNDAVSAKFNRFPCCQLILIVYENITHIKIIKPGKIKSDKNFKRIFFFNSLYSKYQYCIFMYVRNIQKVKVNCKIFMKQKQGALEQRVQARK